MECVGVKSNITKGTMLFICLVMILAFLPGCNTYRGRSTDKVSISNVDVTALSFEEGWHHRDDYYPADFKTKETDLAYIHVAIATNSYDSIDVNRTLQILQDDVVKIERFCEEIDKADFSCKFYIVSDTILGIPQVADGDVFCTATSIEDGSYRGSLLRAVLGIDCMWKQVGLEELIFPTVSISGKEAVEVVNENNLVEAASLFPLFYYDSIYEYADIAKKVAAIYSEWIIKNEGIHGFLDTKEYMMPKYCETAGINVSGDIDVSPISFAYIDSNNKLMLMSETREFRFRNYEDILSATEIYKFISDYFLGEAQLIEIMRNDLKNDEKIVTDNFARNIFFEIDVSPNTISDANAPSNTIYLYGIGDLDVVYHELVHVLLGSTKHAWVSEGMAEYYASFVDTEYHYKKWWEQICTIMNDLDSIYEQAMKDSAQWKKSQIEAEYTLMKRSKRIYEEIFHCDWDASNYNQYVFYESVGIACVLNSEIASQVTYGGVIGNSVSQAKGARESIETNPNSMNYPEAYLFTKYLIEGKGIDSIIAYYTEKKEFEEAFGDTYQAVFPKFEDYVASIVDK